MRKLIICSIAFTAAVVHSANAVDTVFRCIPKHGGKPIYQNTPFKEGECEAVEERTLDPNTNLMSSEIPEANVISGQEDSHGDPDRQPSNKAGITDLSQDIVAVSTGNLASGAASNAATKARSVAEAVAPLATGIKGADRTAAENAAQATLGPANEAAREAGGVAKDTLDAAGQAPSPRIRTTTEGTSQATNRAGEQTTEAVRWAEEAIRLSETGAPTEEIEVAVKNSERAAQAAKREAELADRQADAASLLLRSPNPLTPPQDLRAAVEATDASVASDAVANASADTAAATEALASNTSAANKPELQANVRAAARRLLDAADFAKNVARRTNRAAGSATSPQVTGSTRLAARGPNAAAEEGIEVAEAALEVVRLTETGGTPSEINTAASETKAGAKNTAEFAQRVDNAASESARVASFLPGAAPAPDADEAASANRNLPSTGTLSTGAAAATGATPAPVPVGP